MSIDKRTMKPFPEKSHQCAKTYVLCYTWLYQVNGVVTGIEEGEYENMASLNTVFKKVFFEGLQDEDFAKDKGRQPYLARVVEGGEIIHILTCRTAFCWNRVYGRQYKAFEIFGGCSYHISSSCHGFYKSTQ